VHTDNFIVNDGTAGQTVECIAKLLPHLDGKSATALIIEPVNAINARALVISSQEKEILRILDLVCKEETDDFE
jgi:hypothetical protein